MRPPRHSERTLRLQSERAGMGMICMVAAIAIYWGALLAGVYAGRWRAVDIALVLVAACVTLIWSGWCYTVSTIAAANVFGQARLPSRLWRAWLQTAVRRLSYLWLAFGLGGMLLYAVAATYRCLWLAPAMAAVGLCVGVLMALSRLRVVHGAWFWLAMLGLLLTARSGMAGFDALSALAWPIGLLAALAWPALAVGMLRQADAIQARLVLPLPLPQRRKPLWKTLDAFGRRYTSLAPRADVTLNPLLDQTTVRNPLLHGLLQYLMLPLLLQPWLARAHADPLLAHLIGLFVISALSVNLVVIKDLHWRMLLAPGGLHRGSLGWQILKAILSIQWPVLVAGVALWWLGATFIFNASAAALIGQLGRYWMIPFELLFGALAAVVLTAYLRRPGTMGLVLVAGFLLGGGMWLVQWHYAGMPTDVVNGPVYIGILLLCSAALLYWSNRVWTVQKLTAYLRAPS